MSVTSPGGRPSYGAWPLLAVGVGAALVAALSGEFRAVGYVLSATLAAGALVRAVLPTRWVGDLAVRSRFVDVLLMGAGATVLAVLSATIKDLPTP